jgi:hypothetical protein
MFLTFTSPQYVEAKKVAGTDILLAEAHFKADNNGWKIQQIGRAGIAFDPLHVAEGRGHIELDKRDRTAGAAGALYFAAPSSIVSLGPSLYGAKLCFDLAQPASPGPTDARRAALQPLPDIVLSSSCGRQIGLFEVVAPGRRLPQVLIPAPPLETPPQGPDSEAAAAAAAGGAGGVRAGGRGARVAHPAGWCGGAARAAGRPPPARRRAVAPLRPPHPVGAAPPLGGGEPRRPFACGRVRTAAQQRAHAHRHAFERGLGAGESAAV